MQASRAWWSCRLPTTACSFSRSIRGRRQDAHGGMPDHLTAVLAARCRELSIEPPSIDRVDRIVRDSINDNDERFYADVLSRLPSVTRARLENPRSMRPDTVYFSL